MLALNRTCLYISVLAAIFTFSCKKEVVEKQVYDNVIYQVDSTVLYSSGAEKTKQKSQTQYISILYSDLFNKTISNNELSELNELSLAVGDKTMVNELTLSHFLNQPSVDKPEDAQMRADLDYFVTFVYVKFYQRYPTEYEKRYLKDIIEKDVQMTVDDIYHAFILSDEYYYY